MDWYLLLLFVHVLAGVSLLSALAVEAVAFAAMRSAATPEDRSSPLAVQRAAVGSESIAMATAVVAGIWLMAARWGPDAWTITALVAVAAMGALTSGETRRDLKRIAAGEPATVADVVAGRLGRSVAIRLGLGVAILALMTIKPGIAASAAIVVAGVVLAFVFYERSRARARRPTSPIRRLHDAPRRSA
jgi:hypothetical protein